MQLTRLFHPRGYWGLLLVFALPVLTVSRMAAHKIHLPDVRKVVRAADAVALAFVVKIEVQKSRCETTTLVHLKAGDVIKGSLSAREFVFAYTHYYWRKAEYFWQKECPSVHYGVPPIAKDMKIGDKVIMTVKNYTNAEPEVTGTLDYSELDKVKGMLLK